MLENYCVFCDFGVLAGGARRAGLHIKIPLVDLNNSASQKVVLIFGISSFVGSNLAEVLKKDFKVVDRYRKKASPIRL